MRGSLSWPVLQAKLRAAGLHALISLLVVMLCAWLIASCWYPRGLAALLGGWGLFGLVASAEVVMGPLMSLIIYHPGKPRQELLRDYAVVGLLQVSALFYGLYVTHASRPVYMVFVIDRVEAVSAVELTEADLREGAKGFNERPWWGVQDVCVNRPQGIEERNEVLFSSIYGKDLELMPKYYRACAGDERLAAARPADELEMLLKARGLEHPSGWPKEPFTWLPVNSRFDSWVEIFPEGKLGSSFYLDIDVFSLATPSVAQ